MSKQIIDLGAIRSEFWKKTVSTTFKASFKSEGGLSKIYLVAKSEGDYSELMRDLALYLIENEKGIKYLSGVMLAGTVASDYLTMPGCFNKGIAMMAILGTNQKLTETALKEFACGFHLGGNKISKVASKSMAGFLKKALQNHENLKTANPNKIKVCDDNQYQKLVSEILAVTIKKTK